MGLYSINSHPKLLKNHGQTDWSSCSSGFWTTQISGKPRNRLLAGVFLASINSCMLLHLSNLGFLGTLHTTGYNMKPSNITNQQLMSLIWCLTFIVRHVHVFWKFQKIFLSSGRLLSNTYNFLVFDSNEEIFVPRCRLHTRLQRQTLTSFKQTFYRGFNTP